MGQAKDNAGITVEVALTEQQHGTLGAFIFNLAPDNREERKSQREAIRELKLKALWERYRKKEQIDVLDMSDNYLLVVLTRPTINWLMSKLNTKLPGLQGIILGDVEEILEDAKSGSYQLPEGVGQAVADPLVNPAAAAAG